MKLAEALQERADLNTRIRQLNSRLGNNAVVQEGEKTAEAPVRLLKELNECIDRLEELTSRINQTNARTVIDGISITEMIAAKDALRARIAAYRALLDNASNLARRVTMSEIRIRSAVDVPALQKEVDAFAKELRQTENAIQENNWKTDLL